MTECVDKAPDFVVWLTFIPLITMLWGIMILALRGMWILWRKLI